MIIQTKLKVPAVKHTYMSRPHLYKKLDQGLHTKLTFITAPSGYGKTSALGEWVKRMELNVAWVTFDERDNHSYGFWNHVSASLSGAAPMQGQKIRLLTYEQSTPAVIAGLLNELNKKQGQQVLIWDDFHCITDPVVIAEVNRFMKLMPDHVHLYVAACSYPSLQVSKFKAAHDVIEIGKEELRFTRQETKLFFSLHSDLDLRNDQLSFIHDKLEGWAAGLRLAAMSISLLSNREEAMNRLTGRSKDFVAYYFDEIMSCLDEDLQKFLYYTSILDEMNGELCAYISEMPEAEALLPKLELRNIFITAIDSSQEWYRYHVMFRQFLQFQLRLHEPEAIGKLHVRAGVWMQQNGRPLQALHHYLEAGAYERLAGLLSHIVFDPSKYGQVDVRYWFERIPLKYLYPQPKLYVLSILVRMVDGKLEESRRLTDSLRSRMGESGGEQSAAQLSLWQAGLHLIETLYAYKTKDFIRSIDHWYDYIQYDPNEELFEGLHMPSESFLSLRDLTTQLGSLKGVEVLLKRYLEAGYTSKTGVFSTEFRLVYIALLYEWNRLDEAERAARQLLDTAESAGKCCTAIRAKVILVAIGLARGGEYAKQVKYDMLQLQHALSRLDNKPLKRKVETVMMAFWIRLKELDKAEEWLLRHAWTVTDEITSENLVIYQVYIRLLLAQDKWEEAAELADRVCEYARSDGEPACLIHSLVLSSLLMYQKKDIPYCLNLLEEALYLAESESYIRLFADFDEPIAELLSLYVQSRQGHHRIVTRRVSLLYVKRLLQHAKAVSSPSAGWLDVDDGANESVRLLLTAKEQEVLLFIHQGLSNKLIAREMNISLATVKTHVNNMYKKLGVANRVLAVEKAKQVGLL